MVRQQFWYIPRCLLVTTSLLVGSTASIALCTDYSGYSVEELNDLRDEYVGDAIGAAETLAAQDAFIAIFCQGMIGGDMPTGMSDYPEAIGDQEFDAACAYAESYTGNPTLERLILKLQLRRSYGSSDGWTPQEWNDFCELEDVDPSDTDIISDWGMDWIITGFVGESNYWMGEYDRLVDEISQIDAELALR